MEKNLNYLQMKSLGDNYREFLNHANRENLSHLDFLDAILAEEAAARFDRCVQRRIRMAGFPVIKTLEDFNWDHPSKIDRLKVLSLFDLDFIDNKRNALLIGGTGLGKSHMSVALGLEACRKGYSVLFRTAIQVINELEAAQSDATFLKKLRALSRPQLIIIDELGYLPIDKHGANLLFQVVSERYERGSIVLTTNRAPKHWSEVFNDTTVANAVLDRLAHHSDIIAIEGKSYRTERKDKK